MRGCIHGNTGDVGAGGGEGDGCKLAVVCLVSQEIGHFRLLKAGESCLSDGSDREFWDVS